ncbi:hypothetical protein SCIP_0783 [Scardovia inopinata JCM 12537]|nr:hypothetical protein SCIP_0783 [Scardovia inopinata JCM 12537]
MKRTALKNQKDMVSDPLTEKTKAKPQHKAARTKASDPSTARTWDLLLMPSSSRILCKFKEKVMPETFAIPDIIHCILNCIFMLAF